MRSLVIAVLVALAVPAGAAADTQQASLGPVVATISWTPADDSAPARELRVAITRQGQALADEPVALSDCPGECFLAPGTWPGHEQAVRVADLDRDGEPEVLVDAYTQGAHCACTAASGTSPAPPTRRASSGGAIRSTGCAAPRDPCS